MATVHILPDASKSSVSSNGKQLFTFTELFSLVSYRAGPGGKEGFVPSLETLCVSSALRTEFHGLCQRQTCEIQFFSWDISVIVDRPCRACAACQGAWRTGDQSVSLRPPQGLGVQGDGGALLRLGGGLSCLPAGLPCSVGDLNAFPFIDYSE